MIKNKEFSEIVLTGDRTTGALHIGHYVGSLRKRIEMQHQFNTFVLLADAQAMTDNGSNIPKVTENVIEVVKDYLAVGIDPDEATICLQSQLPALYELTLIYLNLVTVSRLERNPTVKDEIKQRGFSRDIPAGFLCYPVAQAADITGFRGTLIPVGEDQIPMIEQTNEIVRTINRLCEKVVLPEAKTILDRTPRLPGLDGKSKMSKSAGNTIMLSASENELKSCVKMMYTDSNHLRVSDPGQVEGNVVFSYLDAFAPDLEEIEGLKEHYRRGGLGDSVLKEKLFIILNELLEPIRERRNSIDKDLDFVRDVINAGTTKAKLHTEQILQEVKSSLGYYVM